MKNEKGFTLIELLAVIVILGVLMLVAIPAVTRYIEQSKKKAVLSTVNSLVDTVRYGVVSGEGEYSMGASGIKVFDFRNIETEKGKIKDIDGYVKVEKLSGGNGYSYKVYLDGSSDSGKNYCMAESDISQLTSDNMSKCDAGGYTAYSIGDVITFKNQRWRVIKNSNKSKDYVTVMKENVLIASDLTNNYSIKLDGTAKASMAFYWDDTCHRQYLSDSGSYASVALTYGTNSYNSKNTSTCNKHNDYENSKIKEFLEGTYLTYLGSDNLKAVYLKDISYKIRLITVDEIVNDLGWNSGVLTAVNTEGNNVPTWVYQSFSTDSQISSYWTMDRGSAINNVYAVSSSSSTNWSASLVCNGLYGVRPVINLLKSKI